MTKPNDWQCGKSLSECLQHLLAEEIATDVTFVLGEDKQIVRAHKTILISRSPVFYAMLEGPMAEKGDIPIPNISKDTFTVLIRYLYTDQAHLDIQNVTAVLSLARKYCIDCLVDECTAFLKEKIAIGNAGLLLEEAHVYSEENIMKKCLQIITEYSKEFFSTENFLRLCQRCLLNVVQQNDLEVDECDIYEAVLKWSEKECNRQRLEITDSNRRAVMGGILYAIRFPLMNDEYFCREVCSRDILSPDEVVMVHRLRHKKGVVSSKLFSEEERKGIRIQKERVLRFNNVKRNWNSSKVIDAIYFKISKNATLCGFCMYSTINGSAFSLNNVTISCENGDVIYKENHTVTPTSEPICDVPLTKNILLQENKKYLIETNTQTAASDTYYGSGGQTAIYYRTFHVNFYDYVSGQNKTSVTRGQIPGLLLKFKEMNKIERLFE